VLIEEPLLSPAARTFLAGARRAILATIAPDGRPRPVPICFALDPSEAVLYTALDEKPKTVVEPLRLARVRDVQADPRVSVLVDRWDEDWSRLAWLRIQGQAALLVPDDRMPERTVAVVALRAKYPQYGSHHLGARPIIRIAIERVTSWGALEAP
jgi:PPOX class probable F420-dependent enzyme